MLGLDACPGAAEPFPAAAPGRIGPEATRCCAGDDPRTFDMSCAHSCQHVLLFWWDT